MVTGLSVLELHAEWGSVMKEWLAAFHHADLATTARPDEWIVEAGVCLKTEKQIEAYVRSRRDKLAQHYQRETLRYQLRARLHARKEECEAWDKAAAIYGEAEKLAKKADRLARQLVDCHPSTVPEIAAYLDILMDQAVDIDLATPNVWLDRFLRELSSLVPHFDFVSFFTVPNAEQRARFGRVHIAVPASNLPPGFMYGLGGTIEKVEEGPVARQLDQRHQLCHPTS